MNLIQTITNGQNLSKQVMCQSQETTTLSVILAIPVSSFSVDSLRGHEQMNATFARKTGPPQSGNRCRQLGISHAKEPLTRLLTTKESATSSEAKMTTTISWQTFGSWTYNHANTDKQNWQRVPLTQLEDQGIVQIFLMVKCTFLVEFSS